MQQVLPKYNVFITYQDVDDAGVVYFANYFNYAEKARSMALYSVFNSINFVNNNKWAIKNTVANYYYPAKIQNTIQVTTEIVKVNLASVQIKHNFFVNSLCIATIDLLLLSINNNLKPTKICKKIMQVLQQYKQT